MKVLKPILARVISKNRKVRTNIKKSRIMSHQVKIY